MGQKNGKMRILLIRLILVVVFSAVVAAVILLLLHIIAPILLRAIRDGNIDDIESYLRDMDGPKGVILTAILQTVQIISIVLPSPPIHIAAGAVFGAFWGFLICYAGNLLGNVIVYLVYSGLSSKLHDIVGVNEDNKVVKFIQQSSSPPFMVAMACMMPGVTRGLIPYAAVMVGVSFLRFVEAVLAGSVFPIFTMCLLGRQFIEGDFFAVFIIIGVSAGVTLLLTYKQKAIIAAARRILSAR